MILTRVANAVYWFFLSLWFGALVMSGVVAAFAFPAMKSLGVLVPGFEAVPADEHFKIAAGHVLYGVFFATDVIQFVSVIVVTAIIGLQVFSRKFTLPKLPNFVRLAALGVVLVTLSYHLFMLAPRMNMNLRDYWDAAKAGEDYTAYQQEFEADHPTARAVLLIDVLGLAVVVLSSGFLLVPGRDEEVAVVVAGGDPGSDERKSSEGLQLEEPALLKEAGMR